MVNNQAEFTLFTINTPIIGLEEDISLFLDEFVNNESPRFSSFAKLWREKQFIHIIYGRKTQRGLTDILEGIFYFLSNIILDVTSSNLLKIGCLYLMYAFFGKQPVLQQARINVTIECWSILMLLSEYLLQDKQWDAYYIFRQMCVKSAFRFCANSQNLYPGAPLYTRSDVVLPVSADFLTKKDRRKGLNAKTMQNVLSNIKLRVQFDQLPEYLQSNWPAIDTAISRYSEAKMELSRNELHSQPTTSTANTSDEILLWGLNLVTYPDTLNPLSKIIEQFTFKPSPSSSSTNDVQNTNAELEQKKATSEILLEEEDAGKRRKCLRQAKTWSKELNQRTLQIRDKGPHIRRNRPLNQKFIARDKTL